MEPTLETPTSTSLNDAFMLDKNELANMSVSDLEHKIKTLQHMMANKEPLHVEMESKCKEIDKQIDSKESKIKDIHNQITDIIGENQKARNKRNDILKKYQTLNNQVSTQIASLRNKLNKNQTTTDQMEITEINKMKQKCERLFAKYRDFSTKYTSYSSNNKNNNKSPKKNDDKSINQNQIHSLLNQQNMLLYEIMNHYSEYSNIYEQFVNKSLNVQIYNQLIYLLKQILFRKQQNLKRQETLNQTRVSRQKQSNESTISDQKQKSKKEMIFAKLEEINLQLEALSMDTVSNQENNNNDNTNSNFKDSKQNIINQRKIAALDRLETYLNDLKSKVTSSKCIKHSMDIYDDFDLLQIDHIPIFESDISQCLDDIAVKRNSLTDSDV